MDDANSNTSGSKSRTVRHALIVQWSDEDQCYIGSIPDLTYGGCHGDDPRQVFDELCQIADEVIDLFEQDREALPKPTDAVELLRQHREAAAAK